MYTLLQVWQVTITVLIIIVKIDLDASNSVPLYDNPLSCMNLDGIKFFVFTFCPDSFSILHLFHISYIYI